MHVNNNDSILFFHIEDQVWKMWCRFFLSIFLCIKSMSAWNLSGRSPKGVYIHVPFCRRRCFYCSFPIVVVGDRPSTQEQQGEAYTKLLLREMDATLNSLNDQHPPLSSIYFGGGTPSLLPIPCIRSILSRLSSLYNEDTEITLEMDPGTFSSSTLLELEEAGITRLSLGIQSFDNDILVACGRAHSAEDSLRAIETIHSSSTPFKHNFSLDLISSLPKLTLKGWEKTLKQVRGTGCTHVSVYDLQVEDKTAFGRWYTPGVFPLPTDEDSAAMYCLASDILTSTAGGGFEHYEVSNYALPGKRSRHNQLYWQCEPTYGFGMGAASFLNNNRFSRPSKLTEYEAWLTALEQDGLERATIVKPDGEEDVIATKEGLNASENDSNNQVDVLEVVMLALRTSDGLNLTRLGHEYGADTVDKVQHALEPFIDRGLVLTEEKTNADDTQKQQNIRTVRLVDPAGFLMSNDIISSVFAELTADEVD